MHAARPAPISSAGCATRRQRPLPAPRQGGSLGPDVDTRDSQIRPRKAGTGQTGRCQSRACKSDGCEIGGKAGSVEIHNGQTRGEQIRDRAAKSSAAPKAAPAKKAAPAGAAKPDNLRRLIGIGPVNEKLLKAQGITSFAQIAGWTAADIKRIEDVMNFDGRIARERWIEQAKLLAAGNEKEFAKQFPTAGTASNT